MMERGTLMVKDKKLKRFVHVSCARVQEAVVDRVKDLSAAPEAAADRVKDLSAAPADVADRVQDVSATQAAGAAATSPSTLPHGLADSSIKDYSREWASYIRFASQERDTVPGRDCEWDTSLVWEYLQFRARTCKPETAKGILTKLAHFGARCNFVLPTSKFDGDALVYRQLNKMKKQLVIDARESAREAGVPYAPVDRCTPVGRRGVSMMLSAFGLTSYEKFKALPRKDRHHIAVSVMQHTGGMRFGGFPARNYTLDSFLIDARDGTIRLVTDWARNISRRFYIEFSVSPRFEAMWYDIYAPNGDLIDNYPAATVLTWHFRQLQEAGERFVFAPIVGETCSRDDRQAWIRETLLEALPVLEREARAEVANVTPHSFRPGLAGNLHREGVGVPRIGSICRWNTPRVVRIYAERPCLSAFRLTNGFRLIQRF